MGAKIVKLWEFVASKADLQTKMRVAVKSGIPSATAASADDSPENITKMKDAIKEIMGETAPNV
ncbi:hypothetical protein JW859_13345 [bacterium]|nr:hypothetical protein [bacterium]